MRKLDDRKAPPMGESRSDATIDAPLQGRHGSIDVPELPHALGINRPRSDAAEEKIDLIVADRREAEHVRRLSQMTANHLPAQSPVVARHQFGQMLEGMIIRGRGRVVVTRRAWRRDVPWKPIYRLAEVHARFRIPDCG